MHEGARSRIRLGPELPQPLRPFGREQGQALVEFALILPVVLLLLLGMIDFGRAMNYYNDMTQLAAEAARSAAVNHNPDGSVVVSPFTQLIQTQTKAQASTSEIKNNPNFHICLGVPSSTDPKVID